MVEDLRDLREHECVDAVLVEDAIDGGAVAVELACEPADGTFLPCEFFSDSLSDIYHDCGKNDSE